MSRAHRPNHRNPWTGELLQNAEQVCTSCYKNFGSTEAGDAHVMGILGINRKCKDSIDQLLVPLKNKFGAIVWMI